MSKKFHDPAERVSKGLPKWAQRIKELMEETEESKSEKLAGETATDGGRHVRREGTAKGGAAR
jgi:hypothetical protein